MERAVLKPLAHPFAHEVGTATAQQFGNVAIAIGDRPGEAGAKHAVGRHIVEPAQHAPVVGDDGQVIVRLQESLPASQRGGLLLDLEDFLKGAVDPGLAVWLEGLGDRNSLRNLRGIEVKA